MADRTWKINREKDRIEGFIDGKEALEQSVFDMLKTQRFQNLIYSDDYGSQLEWYIGKDFELIEADAEREITDALSIDERVLGIENFAISRGKNDILNISFDLISVFGKSEIRVAI